MLPAGLPNIAGNFGDYGGPIGDNTYDKSTNNLFKLTTGSNRQRTVGGIDRSTASYWAFNASAYNSIYGASATVQPPALCLIPQIKY